MFIVTFQDGSSITEAQVGKWDNVPRESKVTSVGIALPLENKQVLFLNPLPKYCNKYCCTILGRTIVGETNGHRVGYVLYGVRHGSMYRIELTKNGLGPMSIVPYKQGMIAERAWRDGY